MDMSRYDAERYKELRRAGYNWAVALAMSLGSQSAADPTTVDGGTAATEPDDEEEL